MIQREDKYFLRSLVYLAIPFLLINQASAQISIADAPTGKWLTLAEEQYQQGHYRNAYQSSKEYLAAQHIDVHGKNYAAIDKAGYYMAVSGLHMDGNGSVEDAIVYLNSTANPDYKQRTSYAIGQHYFRHNELAQAIPYYEKAGIENLGNREIADSKFELAYCYFNMRQFDKAGPLLLAIKEVPGKYYIPGNYYYGLLAYNQNDYAHAFESFSRITDAQEYKDIVPYYVAEIYYFTGEHEKALAEAKRLLKRKDKLYYDNELHLLAAQVLFEQKKYADALPYFEYYYQHTDKIRKEDLYELAYCYYDATDWDDAIDNFKQLSNTQDSLGQTAMYLLGDCYLKENDRKSARNAFSICADMQYNQGQREASLLLAAKLCYEQGYNDEAITRIKDLLGSFPSSVYNDEAKTILSDLLIKTNNYVEAYTALKEVTHKDAAYNRVLQKVTFGYAMQQLQNGNMTDADNLLTESLKHNVDERYGAAASYWKGELAYKMRRFEDVISFSQQFLDKPSFTIKDAGNLSAAATIENAYVNMGYAAMELKDFKAAQQYFGQVQVQMPREAVAVNATLREADAVFMQKDFQKAISLYDKVIAANGIDADYARYQKALISGVLNKRAEESVILAGLMADNKSAYAYAARYEQAVIYIEADKYQQAINTLMPLTTASDKHSLAPKAWMKIGFAEQQLNADDKAIEAYKHVVAEYRASEESNAALDALKSIYIERNQPDAFAKLLKENNITIADNSSMDSAYYNAAETQFAAGKWSNAKQGFSQYLKSYPNGSFANKANFYLAESQAQLNETDEALSSYDAVLKNSWSDFTERSAARAAAIAYRQKNYEQATNYYGILRSSALSKPNLQNAYTGMMRSSYELKKYNEAASYADTLITLPGLDDQTISEGLIYRARAFQLLGKTDEAAVMYQMLAGSKQSAIASEANYHIAEGYYKINKLKEAEKAVNTSIKLAGGDDRTVVKGYLLLADILTAEKDFFNAKALLQSIVKNAKIAELKQDATAKLNEVKALETKNSKLTQD